MAVFVLINLLDRHMPDARGGDERLRADEMINRPLGRMLWRMRNGGKRDIHALGQIGERSKLPAHIGGAMAVHLAAHIGGDGVDGDQPDIANVFDHVLEFL